MEIQSIPTLHNGIMFRSRLEARWAMFFDELCQRAQYEWEGFDMGPGGIYKPDFFLPEVGGGTWLEIKGVLPTKEEKEKCVGLETQTRRPVFLFSGSFDVQNFQGRNEVCGFGLHRVVCGGLVPLWRKLDYTTFLAKWLDRCRGGILLAAILAKDHQFGLEPIAAHIAQLGGRDLRG